jgi:hypothetical protein
MPRLRYLVMFSISISYAMATALDLPRIFLGTPTIIP